MEGISSDQATDQLYIGVPSCLYPQEETLQKVDELTCQTQRWRRFSAVSCASRQG